MIVETGHRESFDNPKYHPTYHSVVAIVEHFIDCFHTIVTDKTNPYHPPLSWLTRKQAKPPLEELYLDLFNECSKRESNDLNEVCLNSDITTKFEKYPLETRRYIINRENDDGSTPFFQAIKNGYSKIVNYFIETCQPNLEQKGNYEVPEDHHVHTVTPLWIAAVGGHHELVKILIDNGANVNSLSDSGSTPLRSICFLCPDDEIESDNVFFDIVKLLIDRGADIEIANYNGGTCLINSIRNYNLTAYLLSKGAKVNATDHDLKTALHYAIQKGRTEVTKLLLDNGANPFIKSKTCDDALQTSCIYGRKEIFDLLLSSFKYDESRLHDAYKLLGSSMFDLNNDLIQVRLLWTKAVELIDRSKQMDPICDNLNQDISSRRRSIAYCEKNEFDNTDQIELFDIDDFEIQSLIITDRILGQKHKETSQRIITRGTNYMCSLRLQRCLDMWIYSLSLKLKHNSILNLDSMFATQTITKLLVEMILQQKQVFYRDVYDVLTLTIEELDTSAKVFHVRPYYKTHIDLFDTLIRTILNLLVVLYHSCEQDSISTIKLYKRLTSINPKNSRGDNLLHEIVFLASPRYDLSLDSSCKIRFYRDHSPIMFIIDMFIDHGISVDSINGNGLSTLQSLCSSNYPVRNKKHIIRKLVERGAHVDMRPWSPEMSYRMRENLNEAGFKLIDHMNLSCLAARKLMQSGLNFDRCLLPANLHSFIEIH